MIKRGDGSTEIERLARTIGRYKRHNMFAMLKGYTAYFDASGGTNLPETVVAGYVSTVEAWEAFEVDWKIALARYNVPYFHMNEFAGCREAFKSPKWKSEFYRAEFLKVLASIIKSCAIMSLGCGVEHSVFNKMNESFRIGERFNPYALCGRDCAVKAKRIIRANYSDTAPIEYIFECGDEGRGFLMTEMERCGLPTPIFRLGKPSKKYPDIPPTVQLQACDFVAWELRRVGDEQIRGSLKKYRKSFQALKTIDNHWGRYNPGSFREFCKIASIDRR